MAWGCFLLYFITAAENLQQLAFHVSLCFFLYSTPYHGTTLIILYVKAHQICILICQAKISYKLYELSLSYVLCWFYNVFLFKDQLVNYWCASGPKQMLLVFVSSYEFGQQTLLNVCVLLIVKVIWRDCHRTWIISGYSSESQIVQYSFSFAPSDFFFFLICKGLF